MSLLLDSSALTDRIYSGGWIKSSGTAIDVTEPATGEVLVTVGTASRADVAHAAAAATAAQRDWAQVPFERKAQILRQTAALIDAYRGEIADWLIREGGGSRGKTAAELARSQEELVEAAAMLSQPYGQLLPSPQLGRMSLARRVPMGVVGVISPWNFPMLLSLRSVAPALALGNSVLLKPDPQTPISGGALIGRLFEEAGLPAGVLHVLFGGVETGEAVVSDDNVAMISFTGSTRAGRRVGEVAGAQLKRVSLELGGNNALIVLDDADIELAASAGAWAAFLHQGQACISSSRHLVHESIADAYTEALVRRAQKLTVGDPFREDVVLGPIINERQLANIERAVAESVIAGARVLVGGEAHGPFYPATVLDRISPAMPVFAEEIFGPIAPVSAFADDREAITLANATSHGLAAAIHTAQPARGMALANELHCGMLHINDSTINDQAHVPFGGMGASGNGGAFGGVSNLEAFTHWQWVTIRDQPVLTPFG